LFEGFGLGIFIFIFCMAGWLFFGLFFSWGLYKTFGWIIYTHGAESGLSLLFLVRIVALVIGIDDGNISVPSQIMITVSGFLSIK
jgi:hypothetical protein